MAVIFRILYESFPYCIISISRSDHGSDLYNIVRILSILFLFILRSDHGGDRRNFAWCFSWYCTFGNCVHLQKKVSMYFDYRKNYAEHEKPVKTKATCKFGIFSLYFFVSIV